MKGIHLNFQTHWIKTDRGQEQNESFSIWSYLEIYINHDMM